jgi:hypothetical protein
MEVILMTVRDSPLISPNANQIHLASRGAGGHYAHGHRLSHTFAISLTA